jgi:N-methylhydantoinase A
MRYRGQGHEIDVEVPVDRFGPGDDKLLNDAFEQTYRTLYTRVIPGMTVEALTWRVWVSTVVPPPEPVPAPALTDAPAAPTRPVLDAARGQWIDHAVHRRDDLRPGARLGGPALVVESHTTTVVPPDFDVTVDGRGHLVLTRRHGSPQ